MTNLNENFMLRSAGPSAPYTMIANALLQNRDLKPDFIAMIADLISQAPHWRAGTAYLQKRWGWGKNKAREMIALAINLGYMRRQHIRKLDGTFGKTELFVSDDPKFLAEKLAAYSQSEPAPGNRAMDEPEPYQPAPGFTSARKQGPIEKKESLESNDSKKPPHTSDAKFHSYGAGAPCGGEEDFDLREAEQASPPHPKNQSCLQPEASSDGLAGESFELFRDEYPDSKADVFGPGAWRIAALLWEDLTAHERQLATRFCFHAKPEGRKFAQNPAHWLKARSWEAHAKAEADKIPTADELKAIPLDKWKTRMWLWDKNKRLPWPVGWGPRPGEPGCGVPVELLDEYGVERAARQTAQAA